MTEEPTEPQPNEALSDEERARRAALEQLSDAELATLYHALPQRERNASAMAFNLLPLIIAALGFMLDQYIKLLAVSAFKLNAATNPREIPIFGEVFTFTYSENTGGAFSFLRGLPWLFTIFSSAIILAMLFVIFRRPAWVASSFWVGLSLGMALGGATGNLVDRLRQDYVVDVFLFKVGSFRFPIFNVADSLVVVGFIILGIYGWRNGWFAGEAASEQSSTPADSVDDGHAAE